MKRFLRKIFNPRVEPINRIFIYSKNVLNNLSYLQELQPKSAIFPVLKSNAYGHGLLQITKILRKTNVPYIAIDSFPEYQVVKKYSDKNVLVLWETKPRNYKKFEFSRTTFCVYNIETIAYLARLKKKIKIHLFLDTWMHREWVNEEELKNILEFLKDYPKLIVEWVMSHLHSASSLDHNSIQTQIDFFKKMYHIVIDYGHNPKRRHIWNSAGIFKIQDDFFNAYRPWLATYGYSPLLESDPYHKLTEKLKPALQIYSQITSLHQLLEWDWVSYNHSRLADRDEFIASVPFGYTEWLPKSASNKIYFRHNKSYYPQIWTICMNICSMKIPPKSYVFDDVELIWLDWKNSLHYLSKASDKTVYEILVWLDKNIRRETV